MVRFKCNKTITLIITAWSLTLISIVQTENLHKKKKLFDDKIVIDFGSILFGLERSRIQISNMVLV